jgi:ABC-type polysaccharide/polyol phosphate transport system ATPase subunit
LTIHVHFYQWWIALGPGVAILSIVLAFNFVGDGIRDRLEVRDLVVSVPTRDGTVRAVRGVDLDLTSGASIGIVGESGSGKSVTMLAVMGLLPPSARVSGSALVDRGNGHPVACHFA